jgi:quercetin dioxygenase-like cupin family protein
MKTHGVAAASASIAAASRADMARSEAMDKLVTPAEIPWGLGPAVLPAGIQGAVLYWDPTKDGLFSMRFKLPKGHRVAPHTLSRVGLFTVISGTFRIGMGESEDPSKVRAMPAGIFIALAPGTPHFVAVDEETVVQLNNIGPWEITYIDPKDDPRGCVRGSLADIPAQSQGCPLSASKVNSTVK